MTAAPILMSAQLDNRPLTERAGCAAAGSTLVYYAPLEPGGLLHYAVEQVRAFAQLGLKVTVVGSEDVITECGNFAAADSVVLQRPDRHSDSRLVRSAKYAAWTYVNTRVLVRTVRKLGHPPVLISAFVEYFSPLWAPQLRRLHRRGVGIGVVVHDPIRDFQAGPRWWHAWSVSQAYSFVDVAFTHQAIAIDTGWPARSPRTVEVRHGFRDVPVEQGRNDRERLRAALGIPVDTCVLLMFGHIRDGKNLDLVLRAIRNVPNAMLLVVGKEQSLAQRPIAYYQSLADELGVAQRCRWVHDFVPDDEVAKYFQASDVLLLPYSRAFRSTSGVIAVASQFNLRVIASGGEGPLGPSIREYHLGAWCEPDSAEALEVAIKAQQASQRDPNWAGYRAAHCWETNARSCAVALGLNLPARFEGLPDARSSNGRSS